MKKKGTEEKEKKSNNKQVTLIKSLTKKNKINFKSHSSKNNTIECKSNQQPSIAAIPRDTMHVIHGIAFMTF